MEKHIYKTPTVCQAIDQIWPPLVNEQIDFIYYFYGL